MAKRGTACPEQKGGITDQSVKMSAARFMLVSDVTGEPTDLVFDEMQENLDNFTCVPVTITWTAPEPGSTI